MDTSEEIYNKMSACSEIQDHWDPKLGDLTNLGIVAQFYEGMVYFIENGFFSATSKLDKKLIWLPRQDQIQKIMGIDKPQKMLLRGCWAFPQTRYFMETFTSFEQLWLAFYMAEKHGKIWDGEKWIKK